MVHIRSKQTHGYYTVTKVLAQASHTSDKTPESAFHVLEVSDNAWRNPSAARFHSDIDEESEMTPAYNHSRENWALYTNVHFIVQRMQCVLVLCNESHSHTLPNTTPLTPSDCIHTGSAVHSEIFSQILSIYWSGFWLNAFTHFKWSESILDPKRGFQENTFGGWKNLKINKYFTDLSATTDCTSTLCNKEFLCDKKKKSLAYQNIYWHSWWKWGEKNIKL